MIGPWFIVDAASRIVVDPTLVAEVRYVGAQDAIPAAGDAVSGSIARASFGPAQFRVSPSAGERVFVRFVGPDDVPANATLIQQEILPIARSGFA